MQNLVHSKSSINISSFLLSFLLLPFSFLPSCLPSYFYLTLVSTLKGIDSRASGPKQQCSPMTDFLQVNADQWRGWETPGRVRGGIGYLHAEPHWEGIICLKPLLLGLQCMKLMAPEEDLEGAWEGRGEENPVTFKVSSDVTQGDLSKPTVCLPWGLCESWKLQNFI